MPMSRLQQLDQLFAEHFGADPLTGQANLGATSKWVSSQSSESDTNDPLTPESHTVGLESSLDGQAGSGAQGSSSSKDAEHAFKLNNLYSSLAELYSKSNISSSSASEKSQDAPESATASFPGTSSSQPESSPEGSNERPPQESPPKVTLTAQSPQPAAISAEGSASSRRAAVFDAMATASVLKVAQENAQAHSTDMTGVEEEEEEEAPLESARLQNSLRSMMPRFSIVAAMGSDILPKGLAEKRMTPLRDIGYSCTNLAVRFEDDAQLRDVLAKTFPEICEAPRSLMVDDEGHELPRLKYEETSELERKARKEALGILVRENKKHTLVKSFVILESRSTSWKRIGPVDVPSLPASQRERARRQALSALDQLPDAWDIEIYHEEKETRNIKGTARRIFELPQSRRCGLCAKCKGSGKEACGTCKGNEPDECFWCSGTGRDVHTLHKCKPCHGSGKLQCSACQGQLSTKCKACRGEGTGMFCVIVQVKVRRVDFAPIPLPNILREYRVDEQDADAVQTAVLKRTWNAINKLTEASGLKHKHSFRPLSAACSCETSTSQLLEVDVPQNGRFRKGQSHTIGHHDKKRHAKMSFTKRYFVVPSDASLQPVEMSEEDFELSLKVKSADTQASAQLLAQSVRPQDGIYARSSGDSNRAASTSSSSTQRKAPGKIAFAGVSPMSTPAPLMTPAISTLMQAHPAAQPQAMEQSATTPRADIGRTRSIVRKLVPTLSRSHSRHGGSTSSSRPHSPVITPAADGGADYFGAIGGQQSLPATARTSSVADEGSDKSVESPIRQSFSLRAMRAGGTTKAGMYHLRNRSAASNSPPSGDDEASKKSFEAVPAECVHGSPSHATLQQLRDAHSHTRSNSVRSSASLDAVSAHSSFSNADDIKSTAGIPDERATNPSSPMPTLQSSVSFGQRF